jgi:dihydrolipoamide dehydrogenase
VLLLEALERVLPTEDADISRLVERGLKRQGIQVLTGTPVENVQAGPDSVRFSHGSDTTPTPSRTMSTTERSR